MLVTKEFSFDAAHKLIQYKGPCSKLHGHTYKLQVTISGKVKLNGIVIDFVDLKKAVDKKVISRLDHNFINNIVKKSTAENVAIWIWNQLKNSLPLFEIKLWETPTSWVTYRGSEKEEKT